MSSRRNRRTSSGINIELTTEKKFLKLIKKLDKEDICSSDKDFLKENFINTSSFNKIILNQIQTICLNNFNKNMDNNIDLALTWGSLVYRLGDYKDKLETLLKLSKYSPVLGAKKYFLFLINKTLFDNQDKITPEEKVNLLQTIFNLQTQLSNVYSAEMAPVNITTNNTKNVIILINQFLSYQHAPSKIAVDYALALKDLGYNPFIINTASTPRYTIDNAFFNYKGVFLEVLCKIKEIDKIPFYQPSTIMPNTDELNNIVNKIKEYAPSIVFSVGGNDILSDILSKHIKTILIPTSSELAPASNNMYRLISRDFNETDKELFNSKVVKKEKIIHIPHQLKIPSPNKIITKTDLGFNDDNFVVAIVGVRLDNEVTEEFVEKIKDIYEKNPKARFLFIGAYSKYEATAKKHDLGSYTKHIKITENLVGYYCACDVFLNPDRAGGGFSSIYAMKQGLPVITRYIGDIGTTYAGRDLSFDTWDEAIEEVNKLASDKNYYAKKSAIFKQIADSRSDFNQMVKEVIEVAEKLPNP